MLPVHYGSAAASHPAWYRALSTKRVLPRRITTMRPCTCPPTAQCRHANAYARAHARAMRDRQHCSKRKRKRYVRVP